MMICMGSFGVSVSFTIEVSSGISSSLNVSSGTPISSNPFIMLIISPRSNDASIFPEPSALIKYSFWISPQEDNTSMPKQQPITVDKIEVEIFIRSSVRLGPLIKWSRGQEFSRSKVQFTIQPLKTCLLYTSDAADERSSVDLG